MNGKWLGKAHGFMAVLVFLFTTGTLLLVLKFVTEATWLNFSEWIWSAQVIGGIGKAATDMMTAKNGNSTNPPAPATS